VNFEQPITDFPVFGHMLISKADVSDCLFAPALRIDFALHAAIFCPIMIPTARMRSFIIAGRNTV